MKPDSLNNKIRERPWRSPLLDNGFGRNVPEATNIHKTINEPFEVVSPIPYDSKLQKEDKSSGGVTYPSYQTEQRDVVHRNNRYNLHCWKPLQGND
jgi:hypothetical protein